MSERKSEKKKLQMPHIYVLLTGIILVAALLTWVLPASEYVRAPVVEGGRSVVQPESWHTIDRTPVGFFAAMMNIFNGMVNAGDVIFFIFISFGAISSLIASGAFHGLVAGLMRVLKGKARAAIIPIFLAVFGLAASTIGVFEESLPFIPIFVGIAIGLGYDALVGLAIVAVGVGAGYSGAVINPFTVGVAQGIAELEPLSGAGFRIICHVVMIAVASVYIVRYALRVQADPKKSLCYGEDVGQLAITEKSIAEHPFGPRQIASLAAFFVTLVIFVWGVKVKGWYFGEIATAFLLMSIVIAIIMGWSPNKFAALISTNFKEAAVSCLMVGFARGIKLTMDAGHIVDTIVHSAAVPLSYLPKWLAAEFMLIIQTLLNFLIPSGSGQAATSMPIMAPLADVLGLSRQVAVLAFQFGDGFSNILWPTAFAVIMAGIAGIKVTTWWKFLVPLFLFIMATQAVLIAIAVGIGY
jgi:uncharacterized ion transporter superfamily protein YfcC